MLCIYGHFQQSQLGNFAVGNLYIQYSAYIFFFFSSCNGYTLQRVCLILYILALPIFQYEKFLWQKFVWVILSIYRYFQQSKLANLGVGNPYIQYSKYTGTINSPNQEILMSQICIFNILHIQALSTVQIRIFWCPKSGYSIFCIYWHFQQSKLGNFAV